MSSAVATALLTEFALLAGRGIAIVVGGFAIVIALLLTIESPPRDASAKMLSNPEDAPFAAASARRIPALVE